MFGRMLMLLFPIQWKWMVTKGSNESTINTVHMACVQYFKTWKAFNSLNWRTDQNVIHYSLKMWGLHVLMYHIRIYTTVNEEKKFNYLHFSLFLVQKYQMPRNIMQKRYMTIFKCFLSFLDPDTLWSPSTFIIWYKKKKEQRERSIKFLLLCSTEKKSYGSATIWI